MRWSQRQDGQGSLHFVFCENSNGKSFYVEDHFSENLHENFMKVFDHVCDYVIVIT